MVVDVVDVDGDREVVGGPVPPSAGQPELEGVCGCGLIDQVLETLLQSQGDPATVELPEGEVTIGTGLKDTKQSRVKSHPLSVQIMKMKCPFSLPRPVPVC